MLVGGGADPKIFGDGGDGNCFITHTAHLATAAVLPNSPVYSSGAGTLTSGSPAALIVDGSAILGGYTTVLVKNQALTQANGLYTITNPGSGGANWILTRATDFNEDITDGIRQGTAVYIANGTQAGQVYRIKNQNIDVLVASTANVATLYGAFPVMDGVQLKEGDKVLLKNQTTTTENGVYVVHSSGWLRAPELNDGSADGNFFPAAYVVVDRGTVSAGTTWKITPETPTLGSTAIVVTTASLHKIIIGTDHMVWERVQFGVNDLYLDRLEITAGGPIVVSIDTGGRRIFCKTHFKTDSAANVLLLARGVGQSGVPTGRLGRGFAGGDGGGSASDGGNGSLLPTAFDHYCYPLGGRGGFGGDTGAHDGGISSGTQAEFGPVDYKSLENILNGYAVDNWYEDTGQLIKLYRFVGGTGGGGGAAEGGGTGGDGGASGGILFIAAPTIIFNTTSGYVSFDVRGEQGYEGNVSGGDGGGGGGGGGGAIVVVHGGIFQVTGSNGLSTYAQGGNGADGVHSTEALGGFGGEGGRILYYNAANGSVFEARGADGPDGAIGPPT